MAGGGILLFQKMQKFANQRLHKKRSFVEIKIIMGPSGKTKDLLLKQVPVNGTSANHIYFQRNLLFHRCFIFISDAPSVNTTTTALAFSISPFRTCHTLYYGDLNFSTYRHLWVPI